MSDRIEIRDLLLRTIVGINGEERVNRQDVLINVTLHLDVRPAAHSDDIAEAVDYRALTKAIIRHVEESQYHLLETLTERVAGLCLEFDERIGRVAVTVDKPNALRFTRSVAVTVERSREDV
ncbi:MAG: dihydroneopterin aldolase [Planctomycetaceae bacterium]